MFGTYSEKYRQAYSFDPATYVAGGSPTFDVNGSATGTEGAFIPGPGNPFNGIVQCGGPGGPVAVAGFPDAASGGTSSPGCMKVIFQSGSAHWFRLGSPGRRQDWPFAADYGIFYEHTNGNEGNTESLEGTPPLVLESCAKQHRWLRCHWWCHSVCRWRLSQFPRKPSGHTSSSGIWTCRRNCRPTLLPLSLTWAARATHLTLQRNLNQIFPVSASQNPYGPGEFIDPDQPQLPSTPTVPTRVTRW